MRIRIVSLVILFVLLFSCAGYRPVIDPASVQDKEKYHSDLIECQDLAHRNADPVNSATSGAVIGGAIGAGLGAIIAGIFEGNVGRGAAFGALLGGTEGTVQAGSAGEYKYRQIYANCMRGRGYNVLY